MTTAMLPARRKREVDFNQIDSRPTRLNCDGFLHYPRFEAMTAKQLIFHHEAHAKIVAGIDTLVRAVRVTLGPKARTVVLERGFGAPTIINSGVLVAKEIELPDRFENMGVQMVKEVASRTSDVAGDGTTTAML